MKKILLVDATTYDISIPEEARNLKSDYFRAKCFAKQRRIKKLDMSLSRNTRAYSLGLLRIATILHFNKYEVRYIHSEDIKTGKLADLLEETDIVAFGAVTPTVPLCAQICQMMKQAGAAIVTAIGGAHINMAGRLTQDRYPCFDLYIKGYDVCAVSQLVGVPATSLRTPTVYADFDLLPYPLTEYILNTFTTLGCSYRCDYCQDCHIPYYENPDMTGLAPFLGKVPVGTPIHFFDSSIGVNPARTREVCHALASLNHGFLLSCDARAEMITPEIVQMLERAGFVEICFGMEIADEEILRANNRFLSRQQLLQAFRTVRQNSNLYISVYNAIGIPGSHAVATAESRSLLEQWLLHDLIDEVKSCVYVPYPMDGKNYTHRGLFLDNDDWSLYDRQSYPVYHLETMTAQEIWEESLALLKLSVQVWLKKWGFKTIDELPNVFWVEYLTKHNDLKH